jgi:ribonuclease P protein component
MPETKDLREQQCSSAAFTVLKLTSHRLRKHADYQRVYKAGRKQFAKQIAYFYAGRPATMLCDITGPRIGLTVPKALGKAVDRNRIKRRLREAIRHSLHEITAPVDIILHPKRSTLTLEFTVLEREVSQIFRSVQTAANRSASPKPASSKPES